MKTLEKALSKLKGRSLLLIVDGCMYSCRTFDRFCWLLVDGEERLLLADEDEKEVPLLLNVLDIEDIEDRDEDVTLILENSMRVRLVA